MSLPRGFEPASFTPTVLLEADAMSRYLRWLVEKSGFQIQDQASGVGPRAAQAPAERDRWIKKEANDQYISASGKWAKIYEEDPYTPVAPRERGRPRRPTPRVRA